MNINIVEQLKNKLGEIDGLAQEEAYSAKYQIWNKTTSRLLAEVLDEEMQGVFTGILVVSSYRSAGDAQRMYLNHLKKKKEALQGLIDYLKSS